ncbi:MAG: adenylate kinase [Anaerolineae bacterium]|nr:adenylate kinase [Anaerolineae bacterium]
MTIVLIGPSGAGKGTQADRITSQFDWLHISTGDLFRECLEKRTALGLLGQRYMSRGELVPDEVVDAMIEEWLLQIRPEKDILFDGFPRTRHQAEFLDTLLQKTDRQLKAAIYLKVSDAEILKRVPGRLICRTCQTPYHTKYKPPARAGVCDICRGPLYHREDDTSEVIRTRLKVSHRVTGPLVEFYQRTNRLIIVDGEGSISQVSDKIMEALDAIERRSALAATREETEKIQALKSEVPALAPNQVQQRLNIVLLGGPGSGKGTQAEKLRTDLNLPHIATGDLFRENLKNQTDLGKLAKSYMDRGELVPDDVTESMVRERLSRPDTTRGFIMDGFPRTVGQAEALTEMMTDMQRRIDVVLHIKVSDEEIVNRLSGRLICRNCQTPYHKMFKPPKVDGVCDLCGGELYQRDDDNPETIRARLKTYHAQTAPLIDYYRKAGLLVEIAGEGDVSEVTERTMAVIDQLKTKQQVVAG